jgi:uncharacterized protein (DUF3820 family)
MNKDPDSSSLDPTILIDMVNWKMPYGRFKGRLICDLPIEYLIWIKKKGGFPKGRLGVLMAEVHEMKYNDLYNLIWDLKKRYNKKK